MKCFFKLIISALISFNANAICLNSGSGSVLQNAVNSANGTAVILCQKAQFAVSDQINLPDNTVIYTEGKPADFNLWARLYYVSGSGLIGGNGHQAIIGAYGRSRVNLSYFIVDGQRTSIQVEPNLNDQHRYRTNIAIGGSDSIIDHLRIINSIGSVSISASDDPACNRLTITNSFIGYSGFYGLINNIGQWADGIGVYCSNSNISYNEIRDITDGGITFYGGTNTIISNNWVANSGRSGISGIIAAGAQSTTFNSTFYGFAGSQISNNLIQTSTSTHLHVAISAGSRMWCNPNSFPAQGDCSYLNGMSFISNSGNGNFGFGIAVAGMMNALITGNNLTATQWNNPVWIGNLSKCMNTPTLTNWYVVENISTVTPNSQSGIVSRQDLTGCAWYQQ